MADWDLKDLEEATMSMEWQYDWCLGVQNPSIQKLHLLDR